MSSRDELINRYAELKPKVDRLTKELEELNEQLRPYFTEGRGQIIVSQNGVRLRMDGRNQLDAEALHNALSPSMWTNVTKRVPVSVLIKAAIQRGKLKQETVDACMRPVKTWFKIL